MTYETIIYEPKDKIAHIKMNRPAILNAMNDKMHEELTDVGRRFDSDEDLMVAIVSGEGRAFCSGADVRQRQLRPREDLVRLGGPAGGMENRGGMMGLGHAVNWKPVIAAVHGYVLGSGFGLAMGSDLIVAAEETQFQIREVQRGLGGAALWAETWFWGGGRFANEIALTGRYFSAEEGLHHGIVNRVVPKDLLLDEATKLAEEIMTNPPLSVRGNVRATRWFVRKMAEETDLYSRALGLHLTDDFRESASAFMEKREPDFHGR